MTEEKNIDNGIKNHYISAMNRVIAKANSNIALIKYWGKENFSLNIPAVGSLSLTLRGMETITEICFAENIDEDEVWVNDRQESATTSRVRQFLDLFRQKSGIAKYCIIRSHNNFPTGAGLASSASAFAALAVAANELFGLHLPPVQLSIIARMGSGSAARSIFGGIVEMKKGTMPDGSDSYAQQLYDENYWDLEILAVITSTKEKKTKSTQGMNISRETSPYYPVWVHTHSLDMEEAKIAIARKDFQMLGEITEHNCMKMHSVMLTSRPPILYWTGRTLDIIHLVWELRNKNIPAYFTIDAGPQVKILTTSSYALSILSAIKEMEGVERVIHCPLGKGAEVIERS